MKFKHCLFYISLLFILLVPGYSLHAEAITANVANLEISRDELQYKIEQLETKQGVDKDSKARELDWYRQADENLADRQWFEFHSSSYQQILKTAQEELKESETRPEVKVYKVKQQLTEKESELLIVTLKGELRIINDQLSKLEADFIKYLTRPQEIREEILKTKEALKQAKIDINSTQPVIENKYEYEAHQVYLATLVNATLAKFDKLELEATSSPVSIQLNKAAQEALIIQQSNLIYVIAEQENRLEAQQLESAKKLQEKLLITKRKSISKHPVMQQIIQSNIQWSRDLQASVRSINFYEHEIDKIEVYKKEVEGDYKSAEKKIKLAGLSPAFGRVLRDQRRKLASNKQQYQHSININDETGQISLAQYQIEAQQKQLHSLQETLDTQLQYMLDTQKKPLSEQEIEQIRQELQALLGTQKQVLNQLTKTYLKDLRVLGDYDFAKQQLLTQIHQYEAYLDERLLWVPSSPAVNLQYPLSVYHSIRWITSPAGYLKAAQDLLNVVSTKLWVSGFLVIFLIFLLYIRSYIHEKSCIIREKTGKPYTDKIYYTFQVLLFNLLLVLPVTLILLYISWLLSLLSFQSDFSRAVGAGLYHAAIAFLILRFFSRFLEDQGIAELHFRWQKKTVHSLRKQLLWMQFLIIPCAFIIHMTSASQTTEHSDSLGRLGLNIFMLVLFVFAARLFQPNKGVLSDYFAKNKKLWWVKLRYFWFIAFTSIPLIILGFSIMGYYISALELQQKIIITLRMIFIAIIVYSIIIRWLGLTNRELALKNARNQQKAEALNARESDASATDTTTLVDEELLDIPKINEQTEKIVNALISTLLLISVWLIWKNILPAFSFTDNMVLWQNIVTVNGQESTQAVTLTNLFIAGLYIFLISIATLNFPGVMEMLVFRNLDMEAGSRYAVNQLAKYSLISFGFISVAAELGGNWAQVQWLVAALTVGLGFGLQEIFANMVSGIIILFERPIRVGDTVTVDNITGRVARIHMRATTITDWDCKELIVPNKTFITNQLINWTLTDPVTRVVIPLGISYDADVELAHRVIAKTICTVPLVLKEPEPNVFFIGFGESSLDFSIRVYVSEFMDRFPVTHEIHVRLLQALRKEGIEIPFPQRDLHIRSGLQRDVGEIG